MSSMDKVAKELYSAMTKKDERMPKPYDTEAKVIREEGDTIWVKIPGGIDETPVRKTINAKPGDNVQVRVADGRAWVMGNSTNPPTDDTTANIANENAITAKDVAEKAWSEADSAHEAADIAWDYADSAHEAANAAWTEAQNAYQSAYEAGVAANTANGLAQQAQVSADNASEAAATAQDMAEAAQQSATTANSAAEDAIHDAAVAHDQAIIATENAATAQDAADQAQASATAARSRADEAYDSAVIANSAAAGAIESLGLVEDVINVLKWVSEHKKLTSDTTVNPNKIYYILDPNTGTLTRAVPTGNENPHNLGWYELDEAVASYVATHLALTDEGLILQTSSASPSRMIISPSEGVKIFGPDGSVVATYGQSTVIGNVNSFNIRISSSSSSGEVGFYEGSTRVAYINNQSLYITQSVVLDEMMLGENKWVWKYDDRDDSIFLKWMG